MGLKVSSSQLKSRLALLRQPASIAVLISLGIHGVLFGASPSFSSLTSASLGGEGEGMGEPRTVPLVELTPEEQGRLPDFSNSAYSLFPGSGSSSFDLLPVPGATQRPSTSPLSPKGSTTPTVPPDPFGLGSNPFAIGMSPYVPPRRPTVVFPPARRSNLPPVVRQPSRPQPSPGASSARPSTATSGVASTPSTTASTPTASSTPNTRPEPGASDLQPRGNAPAGSPGREGDQVASSGGSTPSTSAQTTLRDQLQALAYNAEATTDAAAEENRQAWLAEVQEETKIPDLALADPIELPPISYSGRVCLSPEPEDGIIGVWVKPDGTLGDDPAVLKSTGYRVLNQQAVNEIAALDFPTTETPAAYEFDIKVNYDGDACVSREQILKSRGAQP